MTDKKTPKWVLWMYGVLPFLALYYVIDREGWRRWFGAFVLVLCLIWWTQYIRKGLALRRRKQDTST
jgi:hypothetical protein